NHIVFCFIFFVFFCFFLFVSVVVDGLVFSQIFIFFSGPSHVILTSVDEFYGDIRNITFWRLSAVFYMTRSRRSKRKLVDPVLINFSGQFPHVTIYEMVLPKDYIGRTLGPFHFTTLPMFFFSYERGEMVDEVVGADVVGLRDTLAYHYGCHFSISMIVSLKITKLTCDSTYGALLGRNWIHQSLSMPSTLHQQMAVYHEEGEARLGFWEMVEVESQPFLLTANVAEASFYNPIEQGLSLTREEWDRPHIIPTP
ncbi:hypothetical protein DVH24_016469, partial [Malus domestica]